MREWLRNNDTLDIDLHNHGLRHIGVDLDLHNRNGRRDVSGFLSVSKKVAACR